MANSKVRVAPDGLSVHWPMDGWRGEVVARFDHEGKSYAVRRTTAEERARGAGDRVCLVDSAGEPLTHWNQPDFCAREAERLEARARLFARAGRAIARSRR
jgi:hypothetical protein